MAKFKVMAFMTTPLSIEIEADTAAEAVAIAEETDGSEYTAQEGGDWEVANYATKVS